jgi:hypothetical protein
MIVSEATRLILATIYWTLIVKLATIVYTSTASCNLVHVIDTRQLCIENGGTWSGFDISGHCLYVLYAIVNISLLTHSSLCLYHQIAEPNDSQDKSTLLLHHSASILGVFLLIVWLVMMIVTCIFFHSFAEKIAGVFLGSLFGIFFI